MYQAKSRYSAPHTFGGILEGLFNDFNTEFKANPPANILETEKSYEVHLVAPGLKKDDFKINLERNILTISYDKKEDAAAQEGKWLRSEYKAAAFKRSFTLNDKVNTSAINAKYTDGILAIELPKKENAEPATQQISVN
ncbi:Hsp20/alpha crystallin family protein [Polluticoccus soli]|uniref:Hsp20/alpha crystallin family protein n=1 Tax=Polluticoccus soli TaxID=3034150 RepID=UPI0023E1D03B|nr:Hsp20/alpha crystallin family protein [Flavipsychrobacter sp. JY13-12]